MNKVTIIGTGNVATHLCIALASKVDELINISSRELDDVPEDSDIYIIAVSDDAIVDVASSLPRLHGIVAHTSGSVPMDVLSPFFDNTGVFYPLQTFTKGAYLEYSAIPVFVEGSDVAVQGWLLGLASLFTTHLHKADSTRRRALHIAAVFACNFVNHMFEAADEILKENQLGIEVLMPLIEATVSKLKYMTPNEAQTGPAARKDTSVLQRHIRELDGTAWQEIYKLITDSIIRATK